MTARLLCWPADSCTRQSGKVYQVFLIKVLWKESRKEWAGLFKKWPLWSFSGFYPEIPFEQVVGDNGEKELPVNWGKKNLSRTRPRTGHWEGARAEKDQSEYKKMRNNTEPDNKHYRKVTCRVWTLRRKNPACSVHIEMQGDWKRVEDRFPLDYRSSNCLHWGCYFFFSCVVMLCIWFYLT